MSKKLSLFSLVMLIVASIDSVRNLPSSAIFGSSLIFFFCVSAVIFLIPTSLVAAQLTASYPQKGGIYHWVHEAFGDKWAMMAIWLQWVNTMIWFPTVLLFVGGAAAYLIHPSLAESKFFLVSCILVVFWGITLLNFRGIHFSSWINSWCGIFGMIVPIGFLIVLGTIWVASGQPIQISFSVENLFPCFSSGKNWTSLIAVMASFLGMELAGVHVNDIKDPRNNFPKAVLLSSLIILVSMVFGALAIAIFLPSEKISLVSGVMQVFSLFFEEFSLSWMLPIMTFLIVVGSIGGMINWLISPAKGLLHAAEFQFLPKCFCKKNKDQVPVNVLLMQAVVVSLLCLLFFVVPGIDGFYWFCTALSTGLYMVMYVLMFFAALKLYGRLPKYSKGFRIPGNAAGLRMACFLGIIGCLATIVVSFLLPERIAFGSDKNFWLFILLGDFFAISPVFFFYLYRKKKTPQVKDAN